MKKHRTYQWPAESELKSVRRKLSRASGSAALPPNATALERAKYELCREFVKYSLKEGINQKELAAQLGVSEARVSEIVRYRIGRITMDRLLRYLERIKPEYKIKVA